MRIAIVEDEKKYADIIREYIERYKLESDIDCQSVWFQNGLDFINDYHPIYDLIFMDIKMPHMDGIEVAKKLRQFDEEVVLIFVTNMAQFAIRGYEVHALDFILKPVKYFDFIMKLNKAVQFCQKNQDIQINIDMGDYIRKVSVRDIYYVEVINHFLIYHVKDQTYKSYGQLKKLEEDLRDANFVKCNNCYLVNLRNVVEVHTNSIVVGKDEIQVSRRRKKEFMEKLANYMGGAH